MAVWNNFPASPAASCDHMTKFWPTECKLKCPMEASKNAWSLRPLGLITSSFSLSFLQENVDVMVRASATHLSLQTWVSYPGYGRIVSYKNPKFPKTSWRTAFLSVLDYLWDKRKINLLPVVFGVSQNARFLWTKKEASLTDCRYSQIHSVQPHICTGNVTHF